jgi:O-antigen/teichoic acid export membrane protein
MAVVGSVKIILMFVLIPIYGHLMQAGLLSGYFVFSVGLMAILGLKKIRNYQKVSP